MILDETEKLDIYYNRLKAVLNLIFYGFISYDLPVKIQRHWGRDNYGWFIFDLVIIVISVFIIIRSLKRIFTTQPALSIQSTGIDSVDCGFIPWADIENVTIENKGGSWNYTFMYIFVNNPEFYIEKVPKTRQKLLRGIYNQIGTPLQIRLNNFKFDATELKNAINTHLKEKRTQVD